MKHCVATIDELDPRTECAELRRRCSRSFIRRASDATTLRALFAARRGVRRAERSGVWRYRELVLPSATDAEIVTHPEGNTPLLVARRGSRTCAACERLLMKHEGHNPTGSFKDRGMTVAMTQARRTGARAVACASTGNTSASLAAYAAQAGIPALVFVPAGKVALGKIAQTLAYGARTLLVRGNFDDCLTLAREASAALGIHLLNSDQSVPARGAEDDRVRAARAARLGRRRTGSRCRPATSATRRRSGKRSARRTRSA